MHKCMGVIKGIMKMMSNKQLFDKANATNDEKLKAILRKIFIDWCQVNGRTPLNNQSLLDWWELESEVAKGNYE